MRIWLLDSGSLTIDHGQLLWNVRPGTRYEHPVYSVLIEHPDGLVLVDTGFDLGHAQETLAFAEPRQTPEQALERQLASCGVAPADVSVLVNSHLHFDHMGANHLLPHLAAVVHERELAQAREPERFEATAYSNRAWDYDGARFETVRGDTALLPGLTLIETPGHSAGHLSLLVAPEGGGRRLLFTFDAVYTEEGWERVVQPGFHLDPVAGTRSILRLHDLAKERGAEVVFPHDMAAWRGYPHAPAAYEL
jgi:4-pyridoxolactonase